MPLSNIVLYTCFILAFLFFAAGNAFATPVMVLDHQQFKVIFYDSPNPRFAKCYPVSGLNNKINTEDLNTIAQTCAAEGDYENYAYINAIFQAYLMYDALRTGARALVTSIAENPFEYHSNLHPALTDKRALDLANKIYDTHTKEHEIFCQELITIGRPEYPLDYMLRLGDRQTRAQLAVNFDAGHYWREVLKKGVWCAK